MKHIHISFIIGLNLLIFISCTNKGNKEGNTVPSVNEQSAATVEAAKKDTFEIVQEEQPNITKQQDTSNTLHFQPSKFQYDLSIPENTFVLERDLLEISGLTIHKSKNIIYAVNDEKGILFMINPENGEVEDRIKFGKRADYEGIEYVPNGNIYAIKSNGNIVAIDLKNQIYTSIKTDLRTSNDVEGLGYLKSLNALVIACKGYPNLEKSAPKSNKVKSIFTYSIEKAMLSDEPIMQIEDESLIAFFNDLSLDISKSKKKKYKKRLTDFSPSAIAYNEQDQLFYILSSVGKTLITVDIDSNIHHIEFLDNTYFVQPEGICFDQENAMYISNEGKGLVAKLMKFERM